MQREQADPSGGVDRVLMRMVAVLRDLVGDVVDHDDDVEQGDDDEEQHPERKVIEEHVTPLIILVAQ